MIAILTASCAPHRVPLPTEASPPHSWHWIDLRAGWRVRVVTPITKSGKFLVKAGTPPVAHEPSGSARSPQHAPGTVVNNFKAGKNLIGYEVSFYSVKPRRGGGVRVTFRSARAIFGGKKVGQPHPDLPLFRLPRNDRFVRILHLARGSHGDHDSAILAASSREQLEVLTKNVEVHPSACSKSAESLCSWEPAGVAVIPEHKKKSRGGNRQWTPAY